MTKLRLILIVLGLPLLAGCADFPDLGAPADPALRAAPYPVLLDLGELARIRAEQGDAAAEIAVLKARAAALRARAAVLRNPIMTDAERRRLLAAMRR